MLNNFTMPSSVEETYTANLREIILLHDRWTMFRQLFVEEQTIKLLWRSAHSFFYLCHYAFLHETILNICRLTDPAKTGKCDNISLKRLVEEVKTQLPKDSHSHDLDKLWSEADSATSFARQSRNKLLAHSDLETYRNLLNHTLEEVTRDKVGKALGAIAAVINEVEKIYSLQTIDFKGRVIEGDANALLSLLLKADM